jgi:putative hydrolase of the HAD superfamily
MPKAVLTNSAMEHAERILKKLGIKKQIDYVFDIKFNNYKGKPHREAFFRALEAMDARPETTLFVDDYPEFVEGFLAIGGNALLMDEFDQYAGSQYERIRNLREIARYL